MKKGENKRYVLPGIFHITGGHNTGKTALAMQCGAPPERILFIDDDVKGQATVDEFARQNLKFGKYINLSEISGKGVTEYNLHENVMNELSNIKTNQYDVMIFDTWTRFADSFHSFVTSNARLFRKEWATMGKIKGSQEWKAAREYEAVVLGQLNRKIPTIFIISHLKSYYVGEVAIPGKTIPAVSPSIERICRGRFWLKYNPTGNPVPVGLVLKGWTTKSFEPGLGIRDVSVLPQKLTPIEGERSLWDTVFRYMENPVDQRELTEDERANEYELSIIENTLSSDQKYILKAMLESGMANRNEEDSIAESIVNEDQMQRVVEMSEAKKPLPLIAKELGITVADVSAILAQHEAEVSLMKGQ